MKKTNTPIDFASDIIHLFDVEISVHFSNSGHYCIPIGNLHNKNFNENINLFCNNLNGQSSIEKEKAARKLHRQFSHPSSTKLIGMLTDANVIDKELYVIIDCLDEN